MWHVIEVGSVWLVLVSSEERGHGKPLECIMAHRLPRGAELSRDGFYGRAWISRLKSIPAVTGKAPRALLNERLRKLIPEVERESFDSGLTELDDTRDLRSIEASVLDRRYL
jgi:hypothetical protein